MTESFYTQYLNSAAIIVLVGTIILLNIRYYRMNRTLDRIRSATYELTKSAREDIEDLQDALRASGIPLPQPRMEERMRRLALSPEEREAESIARFNAVVAETEAQWKDSK